MFSTCPSGVMDMRRNRSTAANDERGETLTRSRAHEGLPRELLIGARSRSLQGGESEPTKGFQSSSRETTRTAAVLQDVRFKSEWNMYVHTIHFYFIFFAF